jgi:1-acyl-sn-glycerol-3-phosphate acyltransferase
MLNETHENDSHSKESVKKSTNFLESLKIDENIGKMREKLNEMKLLDSLDNFFLWTWTPGLQLMLKLMFQFKVIGKENFTPKGQAAVVVMNHQTDLDPFFLNLAVDQKVKWFVKKKNVNIPVVKSLVPIFGLILIPDEIEEIEVVPQVIQMLKDGNSVGFFPEGKISPDGSLQKFHRFPARFCIELKLPYIPVAIIGGNEAFPPHTKPWEAKLGKKVEIHVGKPVQLDPNLKSNPETALKVAEQMQKDVQALMK